MDLFASPYLARSIRKSTVTVGGSTVTDITRYDNMRRVPILPPYQPEAGIDLQYYMRKNVLYTNHTNVASLGAMVVTYQVLAEGVTLEARLADMPDQVPEVRNYQVKLDVQRY